MKIYIEDKVLNSIIKQSELVVDAEMLKELIRSTSTNPRQSEIDKKLERITINTNDIGLVKVIGHGSNDFTIERVALGRTPADN
jgi:hypothetical protein